MKNRFFHKLPNGDMVELSSLEYAIFTGGRGSRKLNLGDWIGIIYILITLGFIVAGLVFGL